MVQARDNSYYFSHHRWERYLFAAKGDNAIAHQLYRANSQLSSQFRILLTDHLEVFIRNALNENLAEYFEDSEWLLNKYQLKDKYRINSIKNKYLARGITPTNNQVLTKLTFGFWTGLFLSRSYAALKGRPIQIFTNRSPKFKRKHFSNSLNRVRLFRNRVNHGEPIIFNKGGVSVSLYQANCIYHESYSLLNQLYPPLVEVAKKSENVQIVFDTIYDDIKKCL